MTSNRAGRIATAALVFLGVCGLGVGVTTNTSWATSVWTISSSPNVPMSNDYLRGVSCVSVVSCEAVGFRSGTSGTGANRTLVESWNGANWSVVPSKNPSSEGDSLSGISCTSSDFCMAVGEYSRGTSTDSPLHTLIESWNGSIWSVIPSPGVGASSSWLDGVSCVSVDSCTAVGGSPLHTLIESWNGTEWSVVRSPIPGRNGGALASVSCVAVSSCVAVGQYSGSITLTLIEAWDGTQWSQVSSPSVGPYGSYLNGVSCASETSCQAVGYHQVGTGIASGDTRALIESWDGSRWSVVQTPRSNAANQLNDVACTSTGSHCVAVGDYITSASVERTLIESWDGTAWSTMSSPNIGSFDELAGVACPSLDHCKATGSSSNFTTFISRTLIESYG